MQDSAFREDTAPVLTPADRKELRARAHHLNPVVIIGEAGLTEAVLAEARRAIAVHELIKVRVLGDDRELRASLMQQLCEALACAPVQMIGKLLVVYRPRPTDEAATRSARPRGPHVPKKAAATGKTASSFKPRRAPAAKSAPRAAEPATGKRVWSTEATGRPSTRLSRADSAAGTRGGRPVASRTEGKRTDVAPTRRPLAGRGRASAATQGPGGLQGKPGARTSGPRARGTKKR